MADCEGAETNEILLPSLPPSFPPSFPPSSLLQLMSAMIQKMGDKEENPLPQETMDGCDSDEWSD